MKRFGSERVSAFLDRMRISGDDAVIKSGLITRQIEGSQKRVEGNNYDSRKQVLQYDDVIREQREVIYAQRHEVIVATEDMTPALYGMFKRTIDRQVDGHAATGDLQEEANLLNLYETVENTMLSADVFSIEDLRGKSPQEIKDFLLKKLKNIMQHKWNAWAIKSVRLTSNVLLSFV